MNTIVNHKIPWDRVIKNNRGFTLIELIVVVSLLSIVLMVTVPSFQGSITGDGTQKTSRWIIANIQALKVKAVREQKVYILDTRIDANKLVILNESMDEEQMQRADENGFSLPDNIQIADVQFPDTEKTASGSAKIRFDPAGYSDKAIIHIKTDSGDRTSYLIEPFLPGVKLVKEYVDF